MIQKDGKDIKDVSKLLCITTQQIMDEMERANNKLLQKKIESDDESCTSIQHSCDDNIVIKDILSDIRDILLRIEQRIEIVNNYTTQT